MSVPDTFSLSLSPSLPPSLARAQVTCQSDLFSFGVTLFVCASGLFPFCDETASNDTIHHALTADSTPATRLKIIEDNVDPVWIEKMPEIIAKSLQKLPENRYATAESMLNDFERADRYA